MVRRFHAQHGPAVFQSCEAQANIEAPRRICRVATKRCRIDPLKEPIHKKRANSFATIGGQYSDAQFEAFSRLRIRTLDRMPEGTSARLRLLEQAEPARSNLNRRFAFPSPRRIWQWTDRRESIVAAAVGPEVQTAQGRAFPAKMARLTLRPGAVRNSPLDSLGKEAFPQGSLFTPGYHRHVRGHKYCDGDVLV